MTANIFEQAQERFQLDREQLKREIIAAVVNEYVSSVHACAAVLRSSSSSDYDSTLRDVRDALSDKTFSSIDNDVTLVDEFFFNSHFLPRASVTLEQELDSE